jgi:hypothetical protein
MRHLRRALDESGEDSGSSKVLKQWDVICGPGKPVVEEYRVW